MPTLKKISIIGLCLVASILFAKQDFQKEQVLEWLTNSSGFEMNTGQVGDFDGIKLMESSAD